MKSVMKSIDTLLNKEILKLQDNENFEKISNSFSMLEDKEQKIIKLLLVFFVIAAPLLFVFIFKSSNNSLLEELKIKEELILKANTLVRSKSDLKISNRTLLGNDFVESESLLKTKISGMLNISGIDASKVKISNIQINPEVNLLTSIKADIKFDSLDNKDFFNFIKNLSDKLRIRVDELSVQKNTKSNLLDGILTIQYLSKADPNEQ